MRSRAFRCGHDVRKRQRRDAELCRGGKLVNKAAEGGNLIAARHGPRGTDRPIRQRLLLLGP